MAEGMITAGTQPQWFEEEESPIAKAIGTLLMQMRAGGITQQQAAEALADMVRRGVPPQVIEDIIDRPTMPDYGPGGAPSQSTIPTEINQQERGQRFAPALPGASDKFSFEDKRTANQRLRGDRTQASEFAGVTAATPQGLKLPDIDRWGNVVANKERVRAGEFSGTGVTPPPSDPFAFEDRRALAARTPSVSPTLQSRQVTQNPDPSGLIRTFGGGGGYSGNTAAVIQDAGYQTPREARRRPTYNRVPKSTPSGSSGGRRSSGPWRLLA